MRHILIPAVPPIPQREGDALSADGTPEQPSNTQRETTANFRRAAGTIETQRAVLQQIFAAEVDPSRHLSQQIDSAEPLDHARALSRSVSEIVLAGGAEPFRQGADRMRVVLDRANRNAPPVATAAAPSRNGEQVATLPTPVWNNMPIPAAAPLAVPPSNSAVPLPTESAAPPENPKTKLVPARVAS